MGASEAVVNVTFDTKMMMLPYEVIYFCCCSLIVWENCTYTCIHVPTYIGANKECLWSGQTADCICIFHFGLLMLKMTAVHRAFHMCIHVHILFCYRCNNATTITMNSDVPSVPITTLAGIHSLTDRKCSS